ncbi:hypothetical protein CapIbe_022171 [Capra ibex]
MTSSFVLSLWISYFGSVRILLQTPWGMFLTTAGGGSKGCVNYSSDNVSFKKLEEVGLPKMRQTLEEPIYKQQQEQ